MRISSIELINYKRFTHLTIAQIPLEARMVILVGPNGSGKTSVLEAMYSWYRRYSFNSSSSDYSYHLKAYNQVDSLTLDYIRNIKIDFHDFIIPFQNDLLDYNALRLMLKGKFYFRTAYRHDPDFTLNTISILADPIDSATTISSMLSSDKTVSENYQRIVASTINGVFSEYNNNKTVEELRNELIAKINFSLNNIFSDLELVSLGNPIQNGSFFFKKGSSEKFHYKNLSAGEKSVFDILLDFIVKKEFFGGAVYCIDEPELHVHTRLQASLIEELYNLLPNDGQLWLSTHSLGILKRAKDINEKLPSTISFLNFADQDFDNETLIVPSSINKTLWQKFIEIALDDFSTTLAPKKVIFCEGDLKGSRNKNFDAQVYSKIFGSLFPEVSFVSIGSSNDLQKPDNIGLLAVKQVLQGVETRIISDRDDKSPDEIAEYLASDIHVLNERHIESYLLEDEIIVKLCNKTGFTNLLNQALTLKRNAIASSASRGNALDDIKSAAGDIYVGLKRLLNLKACGNTTEAFLRDTMAPLVTPETNVYNRLRQEVIG